MKEQLKFSPLRILLFLCLFGCSEVTERKGVVVDNATGEPLEGVSIEIYMKYQKRDSLKEKVFTDEKGNFHIREKRIKAQEFELNKNGYISHVSSLSSGNDTIKLERENK